MVFGHAEQVAQEHAEGPGLRKGVAHGPGHRSMADWAVEKNNLI
ncbi:hypothetical protein ACFCYM_32230 [Streptomyces sp. NPDC056254]